MNTLPNSQWDVSPLDFECATSSLGHLWRKSSSLNHLGLVFGVSNGRAFEVMWYHCKGSNVVFNGNYGNYGPWKRKTRESHRKASFFLYVDYYFIFLHAFLKLGLIQEAAAPLLCLQSLHIPALQSPSCACQAIPATPQSGLQPCLAAASRSKHQQGEQFSLWGCSPGREITQLLEITSTPCTTPGMYSPR